MWLFSPNKHESPLFIAVHTTSFFSPFLGLITVSVVSPSGFRCDLFHMISFCEVGRTCFFTRWVGPCSFFTKFWRMVLTSEALSSWNVTSLSLTLMSAVIRLSTDGNQFASESSRFSLVRWVGPGSLRGGSDLVLYEVGRTWFFTKWVGPGSLRGGSDLVLYEVGRTWFFTRWSDLVLYEVGRTWFFTRLVGPGSFSQSFGEWC